jgi:mannose-6-phosphate isomerase-like protein (cupin superfamily)
MNVVPPNGGEVIGDSPDRRVEILCDDEALNATWSRFGPGRDGADLHIHRRHTDAFYVVAGELTVKLQTGEITVPAGSLARVPPLVVHGFRNASDADVVYLNFHTPGMGFADYMRSVRDGDPITYDQEDPPDVGFRPATDAVITDGPLYADTDELRVERAASAEAGWAFVLEGDDRLPAGSWAQAPVTGAGQLLVVTPR